AFPIRDDDGEVYRIVGVSEDITEEKEAVEEVHRAEERHRSLIENSGDVISVLDARGIVQSTTPSAEELFGVAPDAMENTPALSRVHPDDRDRIARRLAELGKQPGATATESYRIVNDEGRVRHVESIGTNLLHDPAVRGIVINTRDVTEQKELEEQLRQSQKMEAIGQLAGGVAHDFNNLLTVIEGRAVFLQGDLPEDSPLRDDAEEIRRAADRAAALTRQLLAFGKRQILQPEVLDLNGAVLDMEKMLQRIIGEDVELGVEPARRSLGIEVDPAQLQQVILNLVINAREAMPAGGRIVLRLGRSPEPGGPLGPREVETPDNGPRGFCTLTVEDTGEGIPPEIQERIFEPFFTTKETGTGIGLSTVFGIVEQSGGHIELDSTPGEGTTFAVHFPRVEMAFPSEGESEDSAVEVGGGETVLLVEDDDAIRSVVVRTLEKKGYTVLAAASAEEALELVEDVIPPPELLLSDVVMPGMDGPDLAEVLRKKIPGLRLLFMSGYSDDMVMAKGVTEARIDFIGKPFMPDELARKVRAVLDD
ncbi:MAG: ATP-binding protein, partial [Gemmatimonadota bacterium]